MTITVVLTVRQYLALREADHLLTGIQPMTFQQKTRGLDGRHNYRTMYRLTGSRTSWRALVDRSRSWVEATQKGSAARNALSAIEAAL